MKNLGTDLFASACGYIERGLRVFPVHNPIEHREFSPMVIGCSCGKDNCKDVGKHPRIRAWQSNATRNVQIAEQWWCHRFYGANIGSPTGGQRMALDIDNRDGKNGSATLDLLCDQYRFRIPETFTVLTGGGGYHRHLQVPTGVWIPSSAGKLGVGLDVRAEGGFVVMPPSLHKSGRRSEIICDAPLALIPEPLLTLLVPQQNARRWSDHGGTVYLHQRHDCLFHLASSLRGRGLNEAQILEELIKANARCNPAESLGELAYQAYWVATRYPAGRSGKGSGYGMKSLYDLGIVCTFPPSIQAILCFLHTRCSVGSFVQLSYDEINYATGLATQAIRVGLHRLVDIGLVERQRGYNYTMGLPSSFSYRLTPESRRFFQYIRQCRAEA